MTYGSLFSGVGGFDLGFDRAGLRCLWQCEIDPFCRKVLAKHWPHVRRHDDVRTFPDGDPKDWKVDVICGGFPCQDISLAGRRQGLAGERSGLWSEFARVIRLLRPKFVVVENTPGLLAPTDAEEQAPVGCVLGELAECGYDADWQSIPASAFGSTQQRFRVFIVAYPQGHGSGFRVLSTRPGPEGQGAADAPGGRAVNVGVIDRTGSSERQGVRGHAREELATAERVRRKDDTNTDGIFGRAGRPGRIDALREVREAEGQDHADAHSFASGQGASRDSEQNGPRPSSELGGCDSPFVGSGWWGTEPPVVRMVHGLPRRLVRDQIRGLGNSVIPQVAEWIGRRLVEANYAAAAVGVGR